MLAGRTARGATHEAAVPGGVARWLVLVASLAVGVGVAALTMHMSSYWGFSF
jgi:hypothetical protein